MANSDAVATSSVTWHIVWRACAGRNLVASTQLFEQIRLRLIGAHKAPGRTLLHFLVTPTELHLLSALPNGEEPSVLAKTIANVVSRFVHRSDGVPGYVFAGTYFARRVSAGEALWSELRMLAWRPVTLGLCRAVTYYPFSSLRATLGLQLREGFDVLAALRVNLDHGSVLDARKALRSHIARRPTAAEVLEWELSNQLALAVGSMGPNASTAHPVGGVAAALIAASESQDIDGALGLLEKWVLLKLDLRGVAGLGDLARKDASHVRALIACLAMEAGLCSAASVARFFGRAKATLSEQMSVCRRRPKDQAILGVPVLQVAQEAISIQGNARDR